ncbi:methyltransferase [Polaribacter pacificus]|uniref:Methyltransferase n=1 Tax=Polaribacter pacificus TaxID=1775173 RepID=A0A917HZC7_9FLAO|nr:class I SAM-dependent methyltransferase [Polaribacter pacificus]GGG99376.1 methyltransferase [Polaribacter pacificus]
MNTQKDWFTSWFDTPYYHILYKHRDDSDAELFMENITKELQLKNTSEILDIPCGKGRHAVYLNTLGYKVVGADLSSNSINFAKQFENEVLKFEVWDMRTPFNQKFDAIFNLFTSFGYFEDDQEDISILKNFKKGLKENGILVMDFLNVSYVKEHLIEKEIKTVEGIDFHITRKIENGFIIKEIHFFADDENHSYIEKVKYLDKDKFVNYFENAGFNINQVFGSYQLEDFDPSSSKRLIFVLS